MSQNARPGEEVAASLGPEWKFTPIPLANSSFLHQSWPIVGGTLLFQIRTSRVLLGDEYVEIGKVMAEVERLAELLGVGRDDFPPPQEPTIKPKEPHATPDR